MKKKLTSLILAMLLMVQTLVPGVAFATNNNNVEKTKQNLVKVGELDTKSYPKLDNKTILAIQKQAREKHKPQKRNRGAGLFSADNPYLPGQNPTDQEKAVAYGKVNVNFKTVGLNDNGTIKEFQWKEIFGVDSNGNPTNAKIHFIQRDAKTNKELGRYTLYVNKAGNYKWLDALGKEALLPLYSDKLEPYKYNAALDYQLTDKVKLLTIEISTTKETSTFKKDEKGRNVATISLKLELGQVASTKFVSEWKASLDENSRPNVEGLYATKNKDLDGNEIENLIAFPKKNNDPIHLRNDNIDPKNRPDLPYDQDWASSFRNVPEVKVVQGIEYANEDDLKGTPTYNIDEDNKIISSLDGSPTKYKFKYDLQYDVINGGKLTMTEVIPVTFDANGGKFASITKPGAKQEIVKEVDYDGTLTDKAENPTKDRETFKGWSLTNDGKDPVTDAKFANIKEAKTFYAIWDNNDIVADPLEVKESFKDGTGYVNDFIPKLDDLKKQVKIKDASGTPQALQDTDTFEILKSDGQTAFTQAEIDDGTLKNYLYEKLKEKNNPNDEPTRAETVKAKVTHKNGTSQTVDISIKVVKNIYEAKTLTKRPYYVPDNYVKVTLDPTTKAKDPQKTYYYVNPDANVVIPGKDPVGEKEAFTRWTIPGDKGKPVDYKLADRHKFTNETTITAQYEGKIKIIYIDDSGKDINAKYHKDGVEYPSERSGGLGGEANDKDFPIKGPDFKGYVFSGRDDIKGKYYNDPVTHTVTYRYIKKVTTKDPNNENNYFKVVFDANGGKFGADTKKDVYVYFDGDKNTPEPVTFEEVREAVEEAFGKPTKDKAEFKEWQDKDTNGSKIADEHVIKVPTWDWDTYPDSGYTPETYYAHYEQASALVKYLDLDGKPIADEFKIDTEKYPTEKEGKAGQEIDKNVFTAETAPKFTGYKFNRIELNPANGKYSLDNKATIKIYYEEVPDVIPAKPDGSNPDSVPADYVRVEFVPTEKGTIDGDKVFFVNPKKEVTIPVNNPKANATYKFKEWKMGANADGEKYTPSTPKKFTQDTTITATYEETENIIPYNPSVPDPMVRPEGYVRVTFAADPGLKLTEQKAYYVKANAKDKAGEPLTLGNAELAKPKYSEETGYKFDKWDKEDTTTIEAADIVVTAKPTKLDNVIPEKDGEGNTNKKPEGYKEVTFVIKDDDEAKGSITGVAKFYVNPTEYVTINPPKTKAETGFEFGAWDKDATIPTVYKKDATITGSFNGLKDVIPKTNPDGKENKQPAGYNKVEFVIDPSTGGKIADKEVTVYYVNPAKEVTVPQPKRQADTGYEFDKWDQDTTTAKKYTADTTTVKGNFKKLDDIIPSKKDDGTPNAKPDGYVTVTFDKGEHGTEIKGQTVYYVNPKADPAVKLGNEKITKPSVTAKTGYKFTGWDTKDDFEIKDNKTVIAQYESIDDVIPKNNPQGGENKIPEGYITVTFEKGANGELEGNTTFFVNPNKPVVLEGKAPTIKPNTGYTSAGWDTTINKAIKYNDGDKITALYNELGDVIPQEKTDGSDKPDGYFTVTFDKGEHGELSGKTVYYVKPNKKVTVPAPTVNASVGYKFTDWDQKLTQTFTADNTTITAQYTELDKIIPQKNTDGSDRPNGYVTVTFKADANGTLSGTTVYYVKPNVDIDLTDTAKAITKNPNTGYTEEGGTWNPAITSKAYTENAEYTFNFVKLDDVIPEIKEDGNKNKKPDGYITVTLIPTDKATDATNKVYFVNPKAKNVTITNKPEGKKETINGIEYTYVFKGWTVTKGTVASWANENIKGKFTQETEITAQYSTNVVQGELVPAPVAKKNVVTPKGDVPEANDLITNIPGSENDPLPKGTEISYKEQPKVDETGKTTAKVEVKYPNGKTVVVEVPITVVDNVVPQTGKDKPLVPESYVKVIVDTTEKAEENTRFVKTFWVKPNVEVTIPGIFAPNGKTEIIDGVTKKNNFVKWQLEGTTGKTYDKEIKDKFTATESKIVATYEQDKNVEPKGKDDQWIPQGSNPSPKDFIENPYNDDDPNNKDNLPPGTKIEFVKGKEPDTKTPGTGKKTTIKITYPNGETKEVPVKFNVTGDVVEQKDKDKKPEVPDDYVKVVVKTTDKATEEFERTFWVKPNKEVTIPVDKPEGKSEDNKKYVFDSWTWENGNTKDEIKGTFIQDTEIVAKYKTTTKPKEIEQIPEVVSEIPIVSLNQSDIDKDWFKIKNKNETDSKIKNVEIIEKPATDSLGIQSGKAKVTFENGSSRIITIKLKVVDDVIETKDDKRTKDVPDNYKLVILDSTSDALEQTKRYFWINPDKNITLKAFKPQGKDGKVFDKWDRSLSINWNKEGITEEVLTIKAIYKDDNTPGGTTPGDKPGDKPGDNPGGTTPGDKPGDEPGDNPGGTTPGDKPGDKPGTVPENPGAIPGTKPGVVEKHGNRYVERVAGKNRVHTAISTSNRFFKKSKYVIIADSGNYPDALTATVLAHVLDCPILLNNTRYLEDDVAREIVRLGASEVIIVGGHKSISENVKSQLAKYDANKVQRIWGRDRYVTSSELAYEIERLTGKVNKAIIASGENFPDALATAPLGSKEIAPILLVTRNQMDKKVSKALKDLNIKRVYVAGGQNSVSKKLEAQLPQVIRRFSGQDRYETAILVASYTYPESKEVFVASGETFPDALVIGPVCARRKAPILLSKSTPVKSTDDYIEKSKIEYLYIIGGTNTIYADTAHKYATED